MRLGALRAQGRAARRGRREHRRFECAGLPVAMMCRASCSSPIAASALRIPVWPAVAWPMAAALPARLRSGAEGITWNAFHVDSGIPGARGSQRLAQLSQRDTVLVGRSYGDPSPWRRNTKWPPRRWRVSSRAGLRTRIATAARRRSVDGGTASAGDFEERRDSGRPVDWSHQETCRAGRADRPHRHADQQGSLSIGCVRQSDFEEVAYDFCTTAIARHRNRAGCL